MNKRWMMALLPFLISMWCAGITVHAQTAGEASFRKKPVVTKSGNKVVVEFALAQKSDAEVAVLGADGTVVRHLAAGVLGGQTPPPAPFVAGLDQKVEWDGNDDYGQPVAGASIRVRAGMGVKLESVIGGDPYAFWSTQSAMVRDHAEWKISGIEVKSDGQVYVVGTQTSFGSPSIRAYDARGNYLRTVFPPPADKPAEAMKGWNVNLRADGTWTLPTSYAGCKVSNWGIMAGGVDWGRTWSAQFLPSPEKDTLHLAPPIHEWNVEAAIGTDGTLRQFTPTPALKGEPLPKQGFLIRYSYQALAPDGKSMYLSGFGTNGPGFWRDGQVWKVDLATRVPTPIFALTDEEMKDRTPSGHGNGTPFSAFHGVAVDPEGHVFIADRQSKRIAVVSPDGKLIRSLPVEYPEAVGVCPTSKAVYVTTRLTSWKPGAFLRLVKFNDWTKDNAPAVTIPLLENFQLYGGQSYLAVAQDKGETMVWVAHAYLPVRVFKDTPTNLELVKDFYESGQKQRALDMQAMEVDRKTGDVYISDTQSFLFRIRDWKNPVFEPCLIDAKTRLKTGVIALDSRSRHIFTKPHYANPIRRWKMDGDFFTPVANEGVAKGFTNQKDECCTPGENPEPRSLTDVPNQVINPITCSWVFTGLWERGMAACPGGVATLGVVLTDGARIDDYSGPITFFQASKQAPWPMVKFANFPSANPNPKYDTGGIRFDARGNLYVGATENKAFDVTPGFEHDRDFARLGRIYKFAPTGSMESGNLFPTAPASPAKVYDVHYGPILSPGRFGVDEYGRIYYPNAVEKTVGVIDNESNPILSFGSYGNRDSMGSLPGGTVPTKDVPMAWPSSVDATDDFIYVSDRQNVRLLRLAKTFAAAETLPIK